MFRCLGERPLNISSAQVIQLECKVFFYHLPSSFNVTLSGNDHFPQYIIIPITNMKYFSRAVELWNGVGSGNSCYVTLRTELIKPESICSSTIITFIRSTLFNRCH